MVNRYTTIVFDLGNTLIRFDHNIAVKRLNGLFKVEPKALYELFFDSELTHLFEKGLISPEEFHKRAAEATGISLPYEDFLSIWNDIFWPDEKSCDLARRLKGRYRLFLLSNVNKAHFDHIRGKFDIIEIFDELILSYMVGAMKPDKRIFEEVVRRAGGDRAGLVYVDDREDLIKEAAAMGIDSIRYEGAEKLAKDLKVRGIEA